MKKLLLMVILALSVSYYASAEWTTYYVLEQEGAEHPDWYSVKIDWDNNYFFLDSDSEDETKCPIKNLKANGTKKTFDVYYTKSVGGGRYCGVAFEDKGNNSFYITLYLVGEGGKNYEFVYRTTDKKPAKEALREARENPGALIKDGFGKVSDFIKKKKEDNKDKKKE